MSLDGDCLRVGFDISQEFSRTELGREDLRGLLVKTASECAGRTLQVEIASSDRKPKPAPEPASPPQQDLLREKVLKEPLVRSFLETFQGEIEEIKSLETSPEDPSSEQPDKR